MFALPVNPCTQAGDLRAVWRLGKVGRGSRMPLQVKCSGRGKEAWEFLPSRTDPCTLD